MTTNEPVQCSSKGCTAMLIPESGLPPTSPEEARRWIVVPRSDDLGQAIKPWSFCPEHADLPELTSVGAHTLHHTRWDSKMAPKYQVVILKADGTPIPDDEPVMIFRARDPLATAPIRTYRQLAIGVLDPIEMEQLKLRVAEFEGYDDKRMPGSA